MPITMKMLISDIKSAEVDMLQASKKAKVCSSVLQAERKDEYVWDTQLDKARDIAALHNINPSIPRRAGRLQHRENVEADTLSAFLFPLIGREQFTFHF